MNLLLPFPSCSICIGCGRSLCSSSPGCGTSSFSTCPGSGTSLCSSCPGIGTCSCSTFAGCGTSVCSICPGIGTCSCSTFPRLWYISVFRLSRMAAFCVFLEFHLRRLFYISCAPVVPVMVHLCAPLVRHGRILLSPRVLLVR